MDIEDHHSILHKEWASYRRHHGQITNSFTNYCWEGNGKLLGITLPQEAALMAPMLCEVMSDMAA